MQWLFKEVGKGTFSRKHIFIIVVVKLLHDRKLIRNPSFQNSPPTIVLLCWGLFHIHEQWMSNINENYEIGIRMWIALEYQRDEKMRNYLQIAFLNIVRKKIRECAWRVLESVVTMKPIRVYADLVMQVCKLIYMTQAQPTMRSPTKDTNCTLYYIYQVIAEKWRGNTSLWCPTKEDRCKDERGSLRSS